MLFCYSAFPILCLLFSGGKRDISHHMDRAAATCVVRRVCIGRGISGLRRRFTRTLRDRLLGHVLYLHCSHLYRVLFPSLLGHVTGDCDINSLAFDILSLEGLVLIPRFFSVLAIFPYYGTFPCLKKWQRNFSSFSL